MNEGSSRPLDNPQLTEKVAHIQRVVEGECFEIRRTLRMYSEVIQNQRQAIAQRRRTLLLNLSPTYILPERAADRYKNLAQRFGHAVLRRVEQQITLFQIDECWADHLEQMAEVRESIHLFSLGGLDPFHEYQTRASRAFRDLQQRIDDGVVAKFNTVGITADGIDLEAEDLIGPSSTWTYMINDHPFGGLFDRLSRSVKRQLGRA